MNIILGLINGLLLLARLHPKSKATTYNGDVFFEILAEETQHISNEDLKVWNW